MAVGSGGGKKIGPPRVNLMQLREDDELFSLSVLLDSVSKAESKLKGEKKRKEWEMSVHRPVPVV